MNRYKKCKFDDCDNDLVLLGEKLSGRCSEKHAYHIGLAMLVFFCLLGICLCFTLTVFGSYKPIYLETEPKKPIIIKSDQHGIMTIRNHRYLVQEKYGMTHHPDCECNQ